jgi:hypothetical protein
MYESSQHTPHGVSAPNARAAATVLETTARWMELHEDVMIGCECADPALQIKRWTPEVQSFRLSLPASN